MKKRIACLFLVFVLTFILAVPALAGSPELSSGAGSTYLTDIAADTSIETTTETSIDTSTDTSTDASADSVTVAGSDAQLKSDSGTGSDTQQKSDAATGEDIYAKNSAGAGSANYSYSYEDIYSSTGESSALQANIKSMYEKNKNASNIRAQAHYDSYFLSISRPSQLESIKQGTSVYYEVYVRDTWKYYYTTPVIAVFDSGDNIVWYSDKMGITSVNGRTKFYGHLVETKNLKSGKYKLYVFAVPCDQFGNIVSNWSSKFDVPCDSHDFYITAPAKKDISKATAKLSYTTATYTGKALKPKATVTYGSTKLKENTDYTLSYSNNVNVGTATVTIKGKGNYTGSKKLTFKINPASTKLTAVKAASNNKMLVTWTKQAKQTTGYQIQYSLNKNFSSAKTVTVKAAGTTKTTVSNLKKNKVYYVRVRTYKTTGGKTYYSAWSGSKYVKIK